MRQTRQIMNMPITIEIVDEDVNQKIFNKVFDLFRAVDKRYSPFKESSELSKINRGLPKSRWSKEMRSVMSLCEQTKQETDGYFDIAKGGKLDTSGLVKGWAIQKAADLLAGQGFQNFYIDAGGDIQVSGNNAEGKSWRVGIRNPFNRHQLIKVVDVDGRGIATSGTAIRGNHIYNPKRSGQKLGDVVSLTVIGPNIYEADRMATAAFAMGNSGINFIEQLENFEAYSVDSRGVATLTTGFGRFVI